MPVIMPPDQEVSYLLWCFSGTALLDLNGFANVQEPTEVSSSLKGSGERSAGYSNNITMNVNLPDKIIFRMGGHLRRNKEQVKVSLYGWFINSPR